jgi:hypothetical protein
MKKTLMLLSAGFLFLGISSMASALTLTNVGGVWSDTVGGSNVSYTSAAIAYGNETERQVRWGIGTSGQSGLGFTGIAPDPDIPGGIVFGIGDTFEVGQLRHFNNPIQSGSAATATKLTISLDFSDPAGLNGAFAFTFDINETPNTPGPPASDDIISFPDSYASETFEIGGIDYTLQLLGFGDDVANIMNDFTSPEGGTNATKLWGRVTASQNPEIPEPSTILLLGVGLLGLASYSRRRSHKN